MIFKGRCDAKGFIRLDTGYNFRINSCGSTLQTPKTLQIESQKIVSQKVLKNWFWKKIWLSLEDKPENFLIVR